MNQTDGTRFLIKDLKLSILKTLVMRSGTVTYFQKMGTFIVETPTIENGIYW